MKITVEVPAAEASDYLRLIADQLDEGFTSGLWDSSKHWDTERGPDDPKED